MMDAVCLSGVDTSPFPIYKSVARGYEARKVQKHKCPHSKAFLEDMYINQGLTRRQIAETLGVGMGTVHRWMSVHDIRLPDEMYAKATGGQPRDAVMSKKALQIKRQQSMAHKNTHMQYGYVLLYNPGHPTANNYGYTQEHRTVIENYLHRFLKEEEVVHHIDKVRSNNDLSNLALFANDSQHISLHRSIEAWGFYLGGFAKEKPPSVVSFDEPVLWAGEWIKEINLEATFLKNREILNKEEKLC